ncbi:hypothetical protein FSP39_019772 [Pinctada imbricata]|uniref:Uncharacterized protein n=1 Tax=Pinctada imbricata TaxID=66713 RepID=A0AA89C2P6_PINIB|nr:hypothetical protein FSP39_019772 [Pinctada imbricata]
MATQLHVIFSKHFMGAGIIAGVPFACSDGNLAGATKCMLTPALETVFTYERLVSSGALFGNVDSASSMANDKIYIFAGTQDSVVNPGNGKNIAKFYSHFIHNNGNIKEVFNVRAEHSMPTENYGGSCDKLNSGSYLNNCGYNAAFELLNHIYGGNLQVNHIYGGNLQVNHIYGGNLQVNHIYGGNLQVNHIYGGNLQVNHIYGGNLQLLKFDQSEFFHLSPARKYGMDTTGYIYVPSGCMDKTRKCKLHVALHGCEMGRTIIGEKYVRYAGYNEVGEANNIIILYPQAIKTLSNPNGCWDWWGYTGLYFGEYK